jgi:hypothetical protein
MSPQSWRRDWVADKCDVAARLSRGEAGGSYAESAIVVCAALSALSAELWDGPRIDRVRFIEMLTQFGPQSHHCKTVSIPLLVKHLSNNSRSSDAMKIQQAFSLPTGARVLTGPDIDKSEQDVLSVCPQLNIKEVRAFSYASILYSEIRSSYAHQFRPGEQADSWPMTMLVDQKVSYINRMTDSQKMIRLVHIHIEWIMQLAIELASVVDQLANTLPLPKPHTWWADRS